MENSFDQDYVITDYTIDGQPNNILTLDPTFQLARSRMTQEPKVSQEDSGISEETATATLKVPPHLFRGSTLQFLTPNEELSISRNHNVRSLNQIVTESTDVFVIKQALTRSTTRAETLNNANITKKFQSGTLNLDKIAPESRRILEKELEKHKSTPEDLMPHISSYLTEEEILFLIDQRYSRSSQEDIDSVEHDEGFGELAKNKNIKVEKPDGSRLLLNSQNELQMCDELTTDQNLTYNPKKIPELFNLESDSQNLPMFANTNMREHLNVRRMSTENRPLDRPFSENFPKMDMPLASDFFNQWERSSRSCEPIRLKQNRDDPSSQFMYNNLVKKGPRKNRKSLLTSSTKNLRDVLVIPECEDGRISGDSAIGSSSTNTDSM